MSFAFSIFKVIIINAVSRAKFFKHSFFPHPSLQSVAAPTTRSGLYKSCVHSLFVFPNILPRFLFKNTFNKLSSHIYVCYIERLSVETPSLNIRPLPWSMETAATLSARKGNTASWILMLPRTLPTQLCSACQFAESLCTHWPRVGRAGHGNVSCTDLYQEQSLGTPIYEIFSYGHSKFTLRDLAY